MNLKSISPIGLGLVLLLCGCGGGGGGDGKSGDVECGGAAGNSCLAGEFCKYEDLSCGVGTELVPARGVCRPIPLDCVTPVVEPDPAAIVGPVCTCDRLTFKSECFASASAQSVDFAGECP